MKIAFDARMITHPGIGRYISNLLAAILKQGPGNQFILYGDPKELGAFRDMGIMKYTSPIYGLRECLFSPLNDRDSDLVHVPHFNVPFKPLENLVVTVHDLIHLKLPRAFTFFKAMAVRPVILNGLRNAKKIIAVSENTKTDILELLPDVEEKIKVIYEAADPVFRRIEDKNKAGEVRKKYNLPDDIILYVGSLKRHKNIERLVDCYTDLRFKGIRHRLVIIGRYSPREAQILKKIESTDARYLGEIPTEDLVAIYNLASLLVIPSLYEGFGLPALEAMACGLPVVASSASSLPEAVGDAGLLFDPLNTEEMADKIHSLLSDDQLRQSLIAKGLERAAAFSWERAASETLKVYEEVI